MALEYGGFSHQSSEEMNLGSLLEMRQHRQGWTAWQVLPPMTPKPIHQGILLNIEIWSLHWTSNYILSFRMK